MTQQVTIELTGGRVQAYPPTTAKVPTTATTVTPAEPPTYPNPTLVELRALYDEIARLPAGHPSRPVKLARWKTLESRLLGRSAP